MFWNKKKIQNSAMMGMAMQNTASPRPQAVHIDDYQAICRQLEQHAQEGKQLAETVQHQQATITAYEAEIDRLNTLLQGRAEIAHLMVAAIRHVGQPQPAPVPSAPAQAPKTAEKTTS